MTQEQKELLLKDLCSRLPYGVKVNDYIQGDFTLIGLTNERIFTTCEVEGHYNDFPIENIKPYLFSLSSMTEEQRDFIRANPYGIYIQLFDNTLISASIEGFDWLNAHHFDYRGLIEKGLAIEINKSNNPYKK